MDKKVRLKDYIEERESLRSANRLLKFFVVIVGVAVIVNSLFVYYLTQKQKVLIVPPVMSDQMFIYASDASDEYIVNMSRFVSSLMLTYNPGTARIQFSHFLKFCHPSSVAKYKTSLYDLVERIEAGQVSSVFYPQQFKVDRQNKTVYIMGVLNQYTQDKQFITNENRTYVMVYQIENGFFSIKDFYQKKEGA